MRQVRPQAPAMILVPELRRPPTQARVVAEHEELLVEIGFAAGGPGQGRKQSRSGSSLTMPSTAAWISRPLGTARGHEKMDRKLESARRSQSATTCRSCSSRER